MRDLVADHDNLRRALDTALAANDAAVALRICVAMLPFWTSHGDWTEASERLGAALALPEGDEHLRDRALAALGNLQLLRGNLAEAERYFTEASRGVPPPAAQLSLPRHFPVSAT